MSETQSKTETHNLSVAAAVVAGKAETVAENAAAAAIQAENEAKEAATQAKDMAQAAVSVTSEMLMSLRDELLGGFAELGAKIEAHATRLDALETAASKPDKATDEIMDQPAEAAKNVESEAEAVVKNRRFRRL